MLLLVLFLMCIFVCLGVGVLTGVSDIRGLTIPNIYSGVVILAFALAYGGAALGGQEGVFGPLWSHLASGGVFFLVTFVMFALGIIGAADSKIGTAYALWFGLHDLPVYLFFMALGGAALAFGALAMRRWKPFTAVPENSWMDAAQKGQSKVPYGVAIAFGTFIAFFYAGYFSPALLSSFLPGR